MKYTGAIFDFNGTLFFDSQYHEDAWTKLIYSITKNELTKENVEKYIHGAPNVVAIENLFPKKYSDKEKESLSQEKELLYRQTCIDKQADQLVDGAVNCFNYFKEKNLPFTIASASIKENIEFFYERFHLANWMKLDNIIYDNGTYANKIQMFNDALLKFGTEKESCLIFEDSLIGVQNAIDAGFKSIIVIHQHDYFSEFNDKPEIIFHANNFNDVLNFLNQQ